MADAHPSRFVRVVRRLVYCTFGHRWMFVHVPEGLHLICLRCLTTHVVTAFPPTGARHA